jgi:hypothetical protein
MIDPEQRPYNQIAALSLLVNALAGGNQAERDEAAHHLTRHAPEGAVPRLCADLLPILTPGPIRDLVGQLRQTRVVDRVAIAERLRGLIQGPDSEGERSSSGLRGFRS